LIMRAFLAVSLVLSFMAQPALAQGVKDPPNYPQTNALGSKKTQGPQDPAHSTASKGVGTESLPAGMTVQRVWKDGKLTTIPRY
jgi:hypothetical protein